MNEHNFNVNDWKLFKSKISDWQETYIDKLNSEYIKLLMGEESAYDKFWKLEKRIREDKRKSGVIIEVTKSKFIYNIMSLLNEGVIKFDDLNEFSEELKDTVKFMLDR